MYSVHIMSHALQIGDSMYPQDYICLIDSLEVQPTSLNKWCINTGFYCTKISVLLLCFTVKYLTLKVPFYIYTCLAANVDHDQTVQNMQSDL